MARNLFGGSSDDYAVDPTGRPIASRRVRFYTSAAMTTEITDLALDAAGTGSPLTVNTDSHGFWGPVYGPDGTTVMYAGTVDSGGNPPLYVVGIYTHTPPAAGVLSFNTRAGAVSLTKADVTGTALAAADVGAAALGVTAKPRGAWVTATAYAVNDVVTSAGAAYRCLVAHTSGASFSGAGTNWEAWGSNAAYRPLTGMPMLVGYLGDSRMDQGGNTTTYRLGYDFMSQACLRSKGLLPYGSKQGVPGDTTTGMLTRLNGGLLTQASPAGFADCGVVVVLGGTNDWTAVAAGSITLATVKANIVAIATAIKAAGKLPVLCTETPRTAASTYQGYIDDFNTWITRYATANGLPLVDLFSVLVNPSNGQLQAALDSGDNIHPNPAGFAVMADAVIAALSKDLHGTSPLWLPARTGDTKDLLGGKGLFLTGASGLGTSWNNFSAGTAPTLSIANAADVGNWQRISRASGDTGNSLLQWSTGSGFTIGHDYLLTGRLQTSGINAAGSWVTCQVTYNGSAAEASPVFQLAADVPDGIFSIRFTIPTGVTTLKVSFQVAAAPTGACYAQVARVGLYDLTAQGF